jgi:hypothetical protein
MLRSLPLYLYQIARVVEPLRTHSSHPSRHSTNELVRLQNYRMDEKSEKLGQRALEDFAEQFLLWLAEFLATLGEVKNVDGFLAFRID